MRVIVPFSYCLAHSLGMFGAAEVVIGLVLAIWLLFRRPLLFRQPLWSSSRYVLLLRTALCLRHSCCHQKPSFQSFSLQAAPPIYVALGSPSPHYRA